MTGASPGTRRELTLYRFGGTGGGPKVYLQAGLHADEMPGVLILLHLLDLLEAAEIRGEIVGEVLVVPVANPIGLGQWAYQRPQGRHDAASLHNFNRGFPDLSRMVADALAGQLTEDATANLHLVRKAFRAALAQHRTQGDFEEQRVALMSWACDADYVLDLHCDHFAVTHLYASTARPADSDLLARAIGAELVLIADVSGGEAFDEAMTQPWRQLQERFGQHRIPAGCFSATLEYRGQFDVSDDLARADAGNLLTFLRGVAAVDGRAEPQFAAVRRLPLAGAIEVFAPQGGVVSWQVAVGAEVAAAQVLGHVTDPVSRRRLPLQAPVAGVFFRHELWPSCLRGQSLAHVAGEISVRTGNLLSD